MSHEDALRRPPRRAELSPAIKLLAVAEFAVGIGALAIMGETNPLYYLLVIGVALVVVGLVASDQRRRARTERQAGERRAAVGRATDAVLAGAFADPVSPPASVTVADGGGPVPTALRSEREEFVAALVE